MDQIKSLCSQCGKNLKKNENFCKSCGNKSKNIFMKFTDSLCLSGQTRSKCKKRVNGKQKVVYEQKIGDDFYHKRKSWSFLNRIIDRTNDIYYEFVLNKKAGIFIEKKGKLSKHQGYGSAKYKKK